MLGLLDFGLIIIGTAPGLGRSKASFYSRGRGLGSVRRASVTYFFSCEPAV